MSHHEFDPECPVIGPATWFIDPPYQNAGKHYRFGSSQLDYPALAAWCQTREGQVIVCEQGGATWLPFQVLSDVKTTRAGQRSIEVIYLQGCQPTHNSEVERLVQELASTDD